MGVPRDRGSGTAERNEAVRKCQTAGKRVAKRAKVRGHSPQEAPGTSGKVSRSERSEKEIQSATSLERRRPFSGRSVGREGGNCPSHTPSQLEALGGWAPSHPPCRGRTGLPTACPKKLDPGQGRLRRAELALGGRAELVPCHSEDRPGKWPQHRVYCRWPDCAMLLRTQGGSSHCGDRPAPDRHRGSILGHW